LIDPDGGPDATIIRISDLLLPHLLFAPTSDSTVLLSVPNGKAAPAGALLSAVGVLLNENVVPHHSRHVITPIAGVKKV